MNVMLSNHYSKQVIKLLRITGSNYVAVNGMCKITFRNLPGGIKDIQCLFSR